MRDLQRVAPRPSAVSVAIQELMDLAVEIEEKRVRLNKIALELVAFGADSADVLDAAHDLEHGWRHITATRRGLAMAWPLVDE